jgi:hypothetical protein
MKQDDFSLAVTVGFVVALLYWVYQVMTGEI